MKPATVAPRRYPDGPIVVIVTGGARTTHHALMLGMSDPDLDRLDKHLRASGCTMHVEPLDLRCTIEAIASARAIVHLAAVDGEIVRPLPANEGAPERVRKRPDGARSVAASKGWERRREREEFAAVNIPPGLLPLWEREKGRFTEGTPDDRARAFLEWAEAHEADAVEARAVESTRRLAAAVDVRESTDLPREGKLAVIDAELADLLAEREAIESAGTP